MSLQVWEVFKILFIYIIGSSRFLSGYFVEKLNIPCSGLKSYRYGFLSWTQAFNQTSFALFANINKENTYSEIHTYTWKHKPLFCKCIYWNDNINFKVFECLTWHLQYCVANVKLNAEQKLRKVKTPLQYKYNRNKKGNNKMKMPNYQRERERENK